MAFYWPQTLLKCDFYVGYLVKKLALQEVGVLSVHIIIISLLFGTVLMFLLLELL